MEQRAAAQSSAAPGRVEQTVLADLRSRLTATRFVGLPAGTGWSRGADAEYLAELVDYWAGQYDWRVHEDRILALPWELVSVGDGGVRVLHQKSRGATDTVVLVHGWPDSVLRFERVLQLLTDVNVVVPCLPGFPFAPPLTRAGMSTTAMGALFTEVMAALGYQRYVVSGGDVGSSVVQAMAIAAPDAVAAVHLTDVPMSHLRTLDPADLDPDEKAFLAAMQHWQQAEGGYLHEQSTKPHTLAVGLGDSPAGLLAWLVEKYRSWSECGGDVETVFPRDDLLTWVTAYWMTGTIGTSFTPYVEPRDPVIPVTAPTVFTGFPGEPLSAPRSYADRLFPVVEWTEYGAGGHFAAWEQPESFVAGVRSAIRVQAR
jgi:pimeloyl-ACP methyl ester carboxylesterase